MTFIEIDDGADELTFKHALVGAYDALYHRTPPSVSFGRTIVWQGRKFRHVEFGVGAAALEDEEQFYRCWKLPQARLQLGSVAGIVFTTPPQAGAELAGRIKEGGRCGREYKVVPLEYADLGGQG